MKKKRNIIITVIIIAIILITAGLIIYFTDNNSNTKKEPEIKEMTNDEARNYVEKLTDVIINGSSKEELMDVLKTDQILDTDIMTGEDMYLLQKPDERLVNKYKLDDYVETSKKLAERLESAIQNNFEYTIKDVIEVDDYITVQISYKTYYYVAYINDLSRIQTELLIKAGYDLENGADSEQYQVDTYKAKIKAASILDSYLDNYNNENEMKETVVSYHNKNIEDSSDEFKSYLINLTGFTYNNKGILTTQEKVDELLSNYNLEDPLEI